MKFYAINRNSPDELGNGVDDSRPRDFPEAIGELRCAFGVPAVPNDGSTTAIWPFSSVSRHAPSVVMTHPPLQLLRWGRPWSQSVDQPQDFLEQFLRHFEGIEQTIIAALKHFRLERDG